MPVDFGDKVVATLYGNVAGVVETRTVFHLESEAAAPITDSDVLDDLEVYTKAVITPIQAFIGDVVSFYAVDVNNLSAGTKIGYQPFLTTLDGTDTSQLVPTGAALVLRGLTNVLRRQGRKFIPGLTEGFSAGTGWSAPLLTAAATSGLAWITPFTGSASAEDWTPGVYTRLTGILTGFTEVVVNGIHGYQRRRKPGVGI